VARAFEQAQPFSGWPNLSAQEPGVTTRRPSSEERGTPGSPSGRR
jgi:hypothetical protein